MTTTTLVPTAAMPRVDLLPPEILAERRFRRTRFALAFAIVAALGAVGGMYVVADREVSDARADLQAVQAEGAAIQSKAKQFADVPLVYAAVSSAEEQLSLATAKEVRWSYYLNDLSLTIPKHVWVTSMVVSLETDSAGAPAATAAQPADPAVPSGIGTVSFTGTAFRHQDVAVWLEMLAEQPGYANPYLTSSTERMEGSRQVVDFTSEVVVTDAALWRNYLKSSGR